MLKHVEMHKTPQNAHIEMLKHAEMHKNAPKCASRNAPARGEGKARARGEDARRCRLITIAISKKMSTFVLGKSYTTSSLRTPPGQECSKG